MDYSGINEQIEKAKQRIKKAGNISRQDAKEIVVAIDSNKVLDNNNNGREKKTLTKEGFDEILEGYTKCTVEDLEIGNFIRYKQKKDGIIKYVWGGMLIFKDPSYLRLKNVKNNIRWSVQLQNPDIQHVFYQKKKQKLDEDGVYVNLNTASTTGLLAAIVERGDYEALATAAKIAKRNAIKESLGR
jgi:predicted transcriptional regulator